LLSSIQDVCFVFSSSLLAENDYFGCHGMDNLFSVEWEARSHEILSTENDGVVIFEKLQETIKVAGSDMSYVFASLRQLKEGSIVRGSGTLQGGRTRSKNIQTVVRNWSTNDSFKVYNTMRTDPIRACTIRLKHCEFSASFKGGGLKKLRSIFGNSVTWRLGKASSRRSAW